MLHRSARRKMQRKKLARELSPQQRSCSPPPER
jgi:hypothetical protein